MLCSWFVNNLRRYFLSYLLRRASTTYPRITHNVRRLSNHTVVKQGRADLLQLEAEVTRFVRANTSIPVPEVYDFWIDKQGQGNLMMEFVEGEKLQRKWRHLSPKQKLTIMRTLRRYIDELRALPQLNPQCRIESLSHGPCFDFCISSERLHGPFPDEAAYNDWRISTFLSFIGDKHQPTAARLKQLRSQMPDDHRIVFTHGDISRQNILVKLDGNGGLEDEIRITALLDWEQAAWRPEYWEGMKTVYGIQPTSDWAVLAREELASGYNNEIAIEEELSLIYGGAP
jgi:aminoglycoside phosphotransferase (APT) family kinase protein